MRDTISRLCYGRCSREDYGYGPPAAVSARRCFISPSTAFTTAFFHNFSVLSSGTIQKKRYLVAHIMMMEGAPRIFDIQITRGFLLSRKPQSTITSSSLSLSLSLLRNCKFMAHLMRHSKLGLPFCLCRLRRSLPPANKLVRSN